jgi:hypothetical protein
VNTMSIRGTLAGPRSGPAPGPAECATVHTRILRCMLAADDCAAYWRHVDTTVPAANRASVAFAQRWFGIKSEARVRTIMTDMVERFDAYPEALALLHRVGRIPVAARTLICHVHTQLADPVYRRFAGTFLAERREQGRGTVDRSAVARWVDTLAPGRWSPATCTKFASNLLATALDVGLVRGRRDPRKLLHLVVPEVAIGYALYLLRGVRIEGSLTDNPYLRSLGVTSLTLRAVAPRIPGVRIAELGDIAEVTFLEPTLTAWGLRHLGDAA